jgi:hypothetical protein
MTETTSTTPLDALLYVRWVHIEQHHGARLQFDEGCKACFALLQAIRRAEGAEETPDER